MVCCQKSSSLALAGAGSLERESKNLKFLYPSERKVDYIGLCPNDDN